MTGHEKAVLYDDDFGFFKPGEVFYPQALRPIVGVLAELNGDEILEPKSFNANIRLYLDLIIGRFRSFHDTHGAAKKIYHAYRTENTQYCLYLRSFSLGGIVLRTNIEGGRLTEQIGFTATDRNARKFLKALLPATINCLSFINTFDLYPSGNELDKDHISQATIPSFRVLSHNWKAVVREVVRGAKFIILNMQGSSEGVGYELELIRECGLANRTIVIGRHHDDIAAIKGFHTLIDVGDGKLNLDGDSRNLLTQAVRSLSGDSFEQTNAVADLSNLPCQIVDRQIDMAAGSFSPETLSGIPYDLYIPSSLAGNWTLLTELFPKMSEEWKAIEKKMAGNKKISTTELAKVLYSALRVFYVSVTVERYFEMAMALSTMGMAHRAITKNMEIMAACYQHAAECAHWLADPALNEFFHNAIVRLQQEIAANGP